MLPRAGKVPWDFPFKGMKLVATKTELVELAPPAPTKGVSKAPASGGVRSTLLGN
jgi:hypothetical protein